MMIDAFGVSKAKVALKAPKKLTLKPKGKQGGKRPSKGKTKTEKATVQPVKTGKLWKNPYVLGAGGIGAGALGYTAYADNKKP